jgi:hypothetical protein
MGTGQYHCKLLWYSTFAFTVLISTIRRPVGTGDSTVRGVLPLAIKILVDRLCVEVGSHSSMTLKVADPTDDVDEETLAACKALGMLAAAHFVHLKSLPHPLSLWLVLWCALGSESQIYNAQWLFNAGENDVVVRLRPLLEFLTVYPTPDDSDEDQIALLLPTYLPTVWNYCSGNYICAEQFTGFIGCFKECKSIRKIELVMDCQE